MFDAFFLYNMSSGNTFCPSGIDGDQGGNGCRFMRITIESFAFERCHGYKLNPSSSLTTCNKGDRVVHGGVDPVERLHTSLRYSDQRLIISSKWLSNK